MEKSGKRILEFSTINLSNDFRTPGFQYDLLSSMSGRMISVITRPPQNVDVRAILDFKFPCSRPESPGFYSRRLLTKHEHFG